MTRRQEVSLSRHGNSSRASFAPIRVVCKDCLVRTKLNNNIGICSITLSLHPRT